MRQVRVTTKNRKRRQNCAAFAALISNPAPGAVTLPACARLALRAVVGASAGTTAATISGANVRTIQTADLAAGGLVALGHGERGTVVTPAAGFEVLIDIGLGRFAKIAEGV